jgi:SHS2 domain-containing protein
MTGETRFRYLEHTADAKFQAFGKTLEEAYANAAVAVASLMWDPELIPASHTEEVRVRGNDHEQLLVSFLEEILYLWDTRDFLLRAAEDVRIRALGEGLELSARLTGVRDGSRYEIFGDVKAVTYNDMKIEAGEAPLVQVVVDM